MSKNRGLSILWVYIIRAHFFLFYLISKAFNLKYEFHKEAYNILEKYYEPGEFNVGRKKNGKNT